METETVQINAETVQIEATDRRDRFGRRVRNVSLRLPEEEYSSLEQASIENRLSKSQIIRSALDKWIANHGGG